MLISFAVTLLASTFKFHTSSSKAPEEELSAALLICEQDAVGSCCETSVAFIRNLTCLWKSFHLPCRGVLMDDATVHCRCLAGIDHWVLYHCKIVIQKPSVFEVLRVLREASGQELLHLRTFGILFSSHGFLSWACWLTLFQTLEV